MGIWKSSFIMACMAATLGVASLARADELYNLYRGARAQAMGNAFVAVADDEQALFYNPAGLAGLSGPTFHLLNMTIDANADMILNYAQYLNLLSSFSPSTLNSLIGQRLYARVTGMSGFTTRYFGVAFIYDQQSAFITDNPYLPQVTLGYQWTYGIQAGAGFPVFRFDKKRAELRVGVAAKVLWRRGGYQTLPFSDLFNIGLTTLDEFAGPWTGPAFGVDLGFQYVHKIKRVWTVRAGASYSNIGDVTFGNQAAILRGDLAAGVAVGFEQKSLRALLSYDYRNILQDTDWRKRSHLGLMLGVPILSLYAGLNQGYISYGLSADLWIFRVTAVSYGEERGATLFQFPERRYMAQVAVKLGF